MGREATRREMNYMASAMEVFSISRQMNTDVERAVREAVEAAINVFHRRVVIGIRDDLMEKAEDLDADYENDLTLDGVASLLWYAYLLDETLPPEYRKEEFNGA